MTERARTVVCLVPVLILVGTPRTIRVRKTKVVTFKFRVLFKKVNIFACIEVGSIPLTAPCFRKTRQVSKVGTFTTAVPIFNAASFLRLTINVRKNRLTKTVGKVKQFSIIFSRLPKTRRISAGGIGTQTDEVIKNVVASNEVPGTLVAGLGP